MYGKYGHHTDAPGFHAALSYKYCPQYGLFFLLPDRISPLFSSHGQTRSQTGPHPRSNNHISQNVKPSNGCITILAKHGLFVGVIYYICLILSCVEITRKFGVKGSIFLLLLILCFLFSYDFQTRNLILIFVLYKVFNKEDLVATSS